MPNIGSSVPAFLRGRAFVLLSQYASVLPPHLATQFLEEAVRTIETDHGQDSGAGEMVTVKAIRCIKNFHRHLDSEVVRSFARRIISCLVPLVSAAQEDVLVLLLDTVQAVVGGFWGACGAGTGEVMLNWVLHELRRVYADVEIKASDLVMRVRETVV